MNIFTYIRTMDPANMIGRLRPCLETSLSLRTTVSGPVMNITTVRKRWKSTLKQMWLDLHKLHQKQHDWWTRERKIDVLLWAKHSFFSWKKHKHVLCANHKSATKLPLNTIHWTEFSGVSRIFKEGCLPERALMSVFWRCDKCQPIIRIILPKYFQNCI